MDNKVCTMCQQRGKPAVRTASSENFLQDLLQNQFVDVSRSAFPPGSSSFCEDCLKLLALTHQVSVKIARKKEAEERGLKVEKKQPGIGGAGVGAGTVQTTLAQRMRLVKIKADKYRAAAQSLALVTEDNGCEAASGRDVEENGESTDEKQDECFINKENFSENA